MMTTTTYGTIESTEESVDAKTKRLDPTVTHWHLIPTCFFFALIYTVVSARCCLWDLFDGPIDNYHFRVALYVNIGFVGMFLWSYIVAATASPGRMRPLRHHEERADTSSRWFCKTCNQMKPLRCHHCRRCNRCVLKMDHHCFWINNCVGFRNMKFFFLTLFYGTLGCSYMFVIFLCRWYLFYSEGVHVIDIPKIIVLFVASACLMAHGTTVAYLLGFHSFLLSHDRTSVEHRCCEGIKPGCNHDKGLLRNVEETFGPLSGCLFYLLPIEPIYIFEGERRAALELSELYSDHRHARPYFTKSYGMESTA